MFTDKCSLCSVTRNREPITYYYTIAGAYQFDGLLTIGTKTLIRVDAQRDLDVLITCDAHFNERIYGQVNRAKDPWIRVLFE